jgi:hypothetical protein
MGREQHPTDRTAQRPAVPHLRGNMQLAAPRSDRYQQPRTVTMLTALAHNLHAGRGSHIFLGDGRHRAVLDASGRVPTQHRVPAPHRHREPHLGALAALRLVDGARRAAALAEEARLSVGRHWAALPNAQALWVRCAERIV